MYYTYNCTYCERVFYTYHSDSYQAAMILYKGIKAHLIEYQEDHKEYEMDDSPEIDSEEIRKKMPEFNEPPEGAYELQDW